LKSPNANNAKENNTNANEKKEPQEETEHANLPRPVFSLVHQLLKDRIHNHHHHPTSLDLYFHL
jgi:hypothetical protein